jgi:hypothetical protein
MNQTATELMDAIKTMDVQPSIFTVVVIASDHTLDYTASVNFRSTGAKDAPSSIDCHGDTVEEALERLMNTLAANFTRCPHCGRHEYRG